MTPLRKNYLLATVPGKRRMLIWKPRWRNVSSNKILTLCQRFVFLLTEFSEIKKATQLTPDEAKLVEYANSLADWLECYHDYIRPPASVVLAEAAKQTELKTGHPLKGIEIPLTNSNGSYKKEEEAPAIQEPPEIVTNFFSSEHSV